MLNFYRAIPSRLLFINNIFDTRKYIYFLWLQLFTCSIPYLYSPTHATYSILIANYLTPKTVVFIFWRGKFRQPYGGHSSSSIVPPLDAEDPAVHQMLELKHPRREIQLGREGEVDGEVSSAAVS